MTDRPFGCPLDIVLDLPKPLSVNRTRKIDWNDHAKTKAWIKEADMGFLLQKRGLPPAITGRHEIIITLAEDCRIDADNAVKQTIDMIRRWKLVTDDSPKFMRRLTIEFGDVSACRVTVRPMA